MRDSILYHNVNGIKSKWPSISNLIINFDIVCLAETKLRNSDFSPSVNGYLSIRVDRADCSKDGEGGMLVFIKKSFRFKVFKLALVPKDVECIAIKISSKSFLFNIIFVYNPPYNVISSSDFIKLLDQIDLYNNSIVMGDFNAQNTLWGSHTHNQMGINLLTALDSCGEFMILNNGNPTRLHCSASCPDISFTNATFAKDLSWSVLDDTHGSDHFPIMVDI